MQDLKGFRVGQRKIEWTLVSQHYEVSNQNKTRIRIRLVSSRAMIARESKSKSEQGEHISG